MGRAKTKTAKWCQQMYDALVDKDRKDIDRQVEQLAKAEAEAGAPVRRLQLRNQLLLSKVQAA